MNSFIGSLSASGYIKIPVVVAGVNRTFILQWNNIAAAGTSGVLVNYPIAFPNAVLGNLATTSIVAGPLTQYVACSAATTTNVYVVSNSGTPSVMLVSFGY
ncbi:gp53-like domain-containing protein [Pseudomonas nitroreducens]